MPVYIHLLSIALYSIVFLILIYTIRHYWFTLNRLFGIIDNQKISMVS